MMNWEYENTVIWESLFGNCSEIAFTESRLIQCPTSFSIGQTKYLIIHTRNEKNRSVAFFLEISLHKGSLILHTDTLTQCLLDFESKQRFANGIMISQVSGDDETKLNLEFTYWDSSGRKWNSNTGTCRWSKPEGKIFSEVRDDELELRRNLSFTQDFLESKIRFFAEEEPSNSTLSEYKNSDSYTYRIIGQVVRGSTIKKVYPLSEGNYETSTRPWIIKKSDKFYMFFCFRKSEEFVNSGRWYQLAAVSTTDGYEWMNEELNFFNGPHIRSLAYPCTVDFSQSTYLLASGHEFGKEGLIIFKENVEF